MPRTDQPQYEDYKKMIAKHAWSFSRKYGIDFDELQSEGNLIFVEATQKFDSKRAAFGTFLWRCLVTGLGKFCHREHRQTDYNLTDTGDSPETASRDHVMIDLSICLRQSFAGLRGSGADALFTLSHQPESIGLTMTEPPRIVKAAVRDYLRAGGDSWGIIAATMQTLKQLHAEA